MANFQLDLYQREQLEKMTRWIRKGDASDNAPSAMPQGFNALVHAPDATRRGPSSHTLKATLAEASFSEAKFELAKKRFFANTRHHGDGFTQKMFSDHFVDDPFVLSKVASRTDVAQSGLRHCSLYVDNALVGFSVVDILPNTVTVFDRVVDPHWAARVDLQTVMSLRELAVARNLEKKYYVPGKRFSLASGAHSDLCTQASGLHITLSATTSSTSAPLLTSWTR